MVLSRSGVIEYLKLHNTGPDSNGAEVLRIPRREWPDLLLSIREGFEPSDLFVEGDIVVLKSGGPTMTVVGFHSEGVAYCQCFHVAKNDFETHPQKFATIRLATNREKEEGGTASATPANETFGDYGRDTRPAAGCKVLLLMPCATGRLEAELTMPAPPAAKMQIGRAGSVLIEHVRYAPAESLYVCRCCFVRCDATEQITTREGVTEFIKADTGLNWEHCERK